MIYVSVQVREFFGFEDVVDDRELAVFFCLDVFGVIYYLAVRVS